MKSSNSDPSTIISSLIDFFDSTSYIFEFEKEQYLHEHNKSSESILSADPPAEFCPYHAKQSNQPIIDFTCSLYDFDYFSVATKVSPPFYLPINNKWYIYYENVHQLFFPDQDLLIDLKSAPTPDSNGKFLTVTYDNKPHSYKVKKLQKLLKGKNDPQNKPFKLLSFCFEQFPPLPVSSHTISFYSSVVRNPEYLYILTKMDYKYEEDIPFYHVWAKATGPYFVLLLSMLIYDTFQPLNSLSLILRSNNFLSACLTSLIRLDKGFMKFCTKMAQIDSNDPIEFFLDQFKHLELSTFSKVILNILFYSAISKFPQNNEVGFDAVSGVLFLRLMSRLMLQNNVNIKILNSIRKFYNFGNESDNITKLKTMILDHMKLPESIDFYEIPWINQDMTADEIIKIRDRSLMNNAAFVKAIDSEDFTAALNEYRSNYKTLRDIGEINASQHT